MTIMTPATAYLASPIMPPRVLASKTEVERRCEAEAMNDMSMPATVYHLGRLRSLVRDAIERHLPFEARRRSGMTVHDERCLPPAQTEAKGSAWLLCHDASFITSYGVVDAAGGAYRFRRAIRKQVETDLLRFFCLRGKPVIIGINDMHRPFFYFDKATVDLWLDAGGRSWIVAELETRSGRRVIAFPKRGGRS